MIELYKHQFHLLSEVIAQVKSRNYRFMIFIDDLSFLKDDDNFNALKAVLEGSVTSKSSNVAIYATSNRRHIIKERFSDRDGDDVHRGETMQELISLSERFGIHITFSKPNRETFIRIVRHLASDAGVTMDGDEMEALAERFALERGGRSARLARQFVDGLLSKQD